MVSITPDEQNSTGTFLNIHKDIGRAKEVTYHGCMYNAVLVLAEGSGFFFIDFILVQDKTIYFLVKSCISSICVNNLNAFEVDFHPAIIFINLQ